MTIGDQIGSILIEGDNLLHIYVAHEGKELSGTMELDTFINTLSRMFDEQELNALKQRTAELEARLGKRVIAPRETTQIDSPYAGTDAQFGMQPEENGSAGAFRNELAELRQRSLARRRRA